MHVLALRVGGDPYVVRLAEVQGVLAKQRIVPVPSPVPELLGIAGCRGAIVPVYSLRALLSPGGAAGPQGELAAWVLLAGAPSPIGFAFDSFDGTLRVPPTDVAPGAARPHHVHETLRVADGLRGIIDMRSIVERVQRGAAMLAGAGGDKER
jgi:purine-binding chemotaxis protein CheW